MDLHDLGTLATSAASQALTKKFESSIGSQVGADAARSKDVAREFTAFLYLEVLKAMRAASPEEGFLETGRTSRDIYNSMMDSELARVMAKHDKTGLSDIVEKSLRKSAQVGPEAHTALNGGGIVSSPYGVRRDPFTRSTRFHEGVDIAAPAGAPVRAPISGRVVFSGTVPGYGNMVEVNHGNGLRTRYAHNSVNLVSVGDRVEAGDSIALIGSTGRSTGPHVHVEARKDGKAIDPSFLFPDMTHKGRINIGA
jgi:murein DD-endopeptidase MepM/ murein hydrolase activator NlpD